MEIPVLLHLSITFDEKRGAYGPLTYVLNISIHKRATNSYTLAFARDKTVTLTPSIQLLFYHLLISC